MADEKKIKCDFCGKTFPSTDKLDDHKNKRHSDKKQKSSASQSKNLLKIIGIGVVIAAIIGVGIYFSQNQPSATVEGVQCDPTEGTIFHIHAHLDIFVNGQKYTVPAGIGIKPNECLYWLHTHNTSGVIHIESPENRAFTLGQFISVWDKTVVSSQRFENVIGNDTKIQVYVNGNEVKDSYKGIQLNAHDEIVIISGSLPDVIPSTYDFNGL